MGFLQLIFQPIFTFIMVGSFSLLFMQLFFIAAILSAKIQRNVVDVMDENLNLRRYTVAAVGGLIGGSISLFVMVFL